jgi:hypothetical protein
MTEEKRINVAIDHNEPAFFTDNVTVSHSPIKFVIDFSQTTPRFDGFQNKQQQTFVVKHKTLILDPQFAKIFLKVLQQNIEKYEKNFGNIKIVERKQVEKIEDIVEESSTRYIG